MASNGSFSTNQYNGRRGLTFSWWVKEQKTSENYTIIGWNLTGNGATDSPRWYQTQNGYVNINGSRVWTQSGSVNLYSGTVLASGETRINHNTNGEKSFSADAGAGIYTYAVNCTGSGSWDLPKIPRHATMNSASDFTDEGNPSFTYTNLANAPMSCWLEPNPNGTHYAVRNFSGTGGTFIWNDLTEEERNDLRRACTKDKCTCRIGLYSTVGGVTSPSYKDVTMRIVNSDPEFYSFEFEDINPVTLNLTGSTSQNVINVNGYSDIQVTIPAVDKAVAKKFATINRYEFVIGDETKNIAYDDENPVSEHISNAVNGIYKILAVDTRGFNKTVEKVAHSTINYKKITLDKNNCYVQRNNNHVGENAKLTINGTMWIGNFGLENNAITETTYRFKKTTSSTWITGTTTLTPTVSQDGEFTLSDVQISSDNTNPDEWDLGSSYDFEITIKDKLSTATLRLSPMTSGTPSISLADTGVGIMGDYDENLGGNLQVAGGKVLSAYTLFNDDNNTSDSITLSDNLIYYDYIEIYCKEKTVSINGYMKVSEPNNKYVTLNIQKMTNSGGYMTHYFSRYYLVGTTISLYRNGHYNIVNNTVADCGVNDTNADILITKVIGYK